MIWQISSVETVSIRTLRGLRDSVWSLLRSTAIVKQDSYLMYVRGVLVLDSCNLTVQALRAAMFLTPSINELADTLDVNRHLSDMLSG